MKGTMVEFASHADGATYDGYLAKPESGSGPGVIVIQEWWGLVNHIKDLADRFAAEGFVALAPDLYGGKVATEPDEAGKLMMSLNIAEAERILSLAIGRLLDDDATTSASVGAVGFCMGGQLALFAAGANPGVTACVDFYGIHPNVTPSYQNFVGPVLGIFAERDTSASPAAVAALGAALDAHGKPHEFITYPGTDHAFFNDARPEVYNAAASQDAWARVLTFLRAHVN
ncbi:MAG: dienelactone hydrolase family protein [Fimbriimonadaceae bacterium]